MLKLNELWIALGEQVYHLDAEEKYIHPWACLRQMMITMKRKLIPFANELIFPLGIRLLRGTMLLEFPREHLQMLNEDTIYCHPYVRCSCGSDKVVNYGIPKNNGRYFFCRTCEKAFKTPAAQHLHNQGQTPANNRQSA